MGGVLSIAERIAQRTVRKSGRPPFILQGTPTDWCLYEPEGNRPWSEDELRAIAQDLRETANILSERADKAAGKEPDMVLADIQIYEGLGTTFWKSSRIETPEQYGWLRERLEACKNAHHPAQSEA